MSLRKHAESELNRLGVEVEIKDSILKMIDAFNEVGHSGGSAFYTIDLIHRLLNWENLTPLTQDPNEWNNVGNGMWQSQRNPKVFSEDGGQTWYNLDDRDTERPWVEQVMARWGDPGVQPPIEGAVKLQSGLMRSVWVWFPEENPVNHGLHIDRMGTHNELKVWRHHSTTGGVGQEVTWVQPGDFTNDQIMAAIKQVWGW